MTGPEHFTERDELTAYYETLSAEIAAIADPRAYIHETLIPAMDVHRGRTVPLTFSDVFQRLFATGDKPGEMVEYFEELRKHRGLTPALALEMADMVYNMERLEAIDDEPVDIAPYIEEWSRIPADAARRICIVKYRTRMERTSPLPKEDRDQIEEYTMARFLQESDISAGITAFQEEYKRRDQETARQRMQEDLGTTEEQFAALRNRNQ